LALRTAKSYKSKKTITLFLDEEIFSINKSRIEVHTDPRVLDFRNFCSNLQTKANNSD
jgi:hypothetical protein